LRALLALQSQIYFQHNAGGSGVGAQSDASAYLTVH